MGYGRAERRKTDVMVEKKVREMEGGKEIEEEVKVKEQLGRRDQGEI